MAKNETVPRRTNIQEVPNIFGWQTGLAVFLGGKFKLMESNETSQRRVGNSRLFASSFCLLIYPVILRILGFLKLLI